MLYNDFSPNTNILIFNKFNFQSGSILNAMEKSVPSIYEYTSFRKWLSDFCEAQKIQSGAFSFRSFAKQVGFASPNYLQMVIVGKRNLSEDSALKVAKAAGLGKKEAGYFKLLVGFAQTDDLADKNRYFTKIVKYKNRESSVKIIADQYDYYSEWYHCVIRELAVGLKASAIDYTALANRVLPKILPKQAKKSVALLCRLGFLYVSKEGLLAQASPLITTDREAQSVAIRNFHGKMLGLAKGSLETTPPAEREISSITMKISPQGFDRIKTRIQDFKEELMQIIREDKNVDQVYEASFLFFPVSLKKIDDKESTV